MGGTEEFPVALIQRTAAVCEWFLLVTILLTAIYSHAVRLVPMQIIQTTQTRYVKFAKVKLHLQRACSVLY